MQLQKDYAQKYPGAKIVPAEVYASPSFHHGEDVFCLFHPNGQLLAYAVVYPVFASNNNQFSACHVGRSKNFSIHW